jgi:hypothetical protein
MVSSSRPRTPSTGLSPPPDTKLAAIPEANKALPARRSSLGLLLRRKSGDMKGSKKQQALAKEQELQRQAVAIPQAPPRLPDIYNGAAPPQLQPFGGDSAAHPMDNSHLPAAYGNVPIPPIPANGYRNGDWVDPYARTESMTHRGRYSYASSAVSTINSPRRVRRRKDPTPFKYVSCLDSSITSPLSPKNTTDPDSLQHPHHWCPCLWQDLFPQLPQDISGSSCEEEKRP